MPYGSLIYHIYVYVYIDIVDVQIKTDFHFLKYYYFFVVRNIQNSFFWIFKYTILATLLLSVVNSLCDRASELIFPSYLFVFTDQSKDIFKTT